MKNSKDVATFSTRVFLLQYGHNAISIAVAEQYIAAFSNIAKTNNTVLLPSNTGDVTSSVAQVAYHNMLLQFWIAVVSGEWYQYHQCTLQMFTYIEFTHE